MQNSPEWVCWCPYTENLEQRGFKSPPLSIRLFWQLQNCRERDLVKIQYWLQHIAPPQNAQLLKREIREEVKKGEFRTFGNKHFWPKNLQNPGTCPLPDIFLWTRPVWDIWGMLLWHWCNLSDMGGVVRAFICQIAPRQTRLLISRSRHQGRSRCRIFSPPPSWSTCFLR